MPDRAEAPLYQAAGSAGVRLHGMGRAGGRPDRISELPHRQPAPHRGAGGVWAGGIGAYAGQNGCHHGSVGWRGRAETGHPFRGAACRCAGKAGHGRGRDPLSHAARRRFGPQRQCLCRRPQAPERESRSQGRAGRFLCLACRGRPGTAEPEREPELQSGAGCGRPERGLPLPLRGRAGGLYAHGGRRGGTRPPDRHPDAAPAGVEALPAAVRGGCLLHEI